MPHEREQGHGHHRKKKVTKVKLSPNDKRNDRIFFSYLLITASALAVVFAYQWVAMIKP